MTITDSVISLIILLLATNGYYQGFAGSIAGPLCFLAGSLIGYTAYLLTRNAGGGFLACVLCSFFFNWLLKTIWRLRGQQTPGKISRLSRALGALLHVSWGIMVILFVLLLLTFLPLKEGRFAFAWKDMNSSLAYQYISQQIKERDILGGRSLACAGGLCSLDEEGLTALTEDKEVISMMNDPRMQKLINSPKLQKAVLNQDTAAIMNDPDVKSLTKDPGFLIKALRVYPKILKNSGAGEL
jgi:uncharacterized membrane protein required for colicin V production